MQKIKVPFGCFWFVDQLLITQSDLAPNSIHVYTLVKHSWVFVGTVEY
jgi:hypothetical protein